MPDDLQRLVLKDFKGYLTGETSAITINPPYIETAKNLKFRQHLTRPLEGYSLDQTPFTNYIRLLLPMTTTAGSDRLVMSDGVDWKYTTANGSSQYFGYTTGTATRSGTALTGSSTDWDGNIEAGDQFKYDADSTWINIASVNSDTSITLSTSTGATSGAYTIRKIMVGTTLPSGTVLGGKAILSDNDRIHDSYDGLSLVTIANMPVVKGLTVHKRHVFGWTNTNIYWSDINAPTTWVTTNTEPIASNDGGDIIKCISYANALVIFKDNGKIYSFVGEAPFDATLLNYSILENDTPTRIGTMAPNTIVIYQGLLWFLTSLGWYTFDGVSVTRIETPISGESGNHEFTPEFPTGAGGTSTQSWTDESTEFSSGTLSDMEVNGSGELQLTALKTFDDFSDGDYTADPTWTVDTGTFTVTSNKLQISGGSPAGRIRVPTTNAYGSWEFVLTYSGPSGWSMDNYVIFVADDSTFASADGYAIRYHTGNSGIDTIRLVGITSGTGSSTLIQKTGLSYSSVTIKITRTSAGQFELFFDGVSQGTVTDTTVTTSTTLYWRTTVVSFVAGGPTLTLDTIKMSALSGTFISRVLDGTTSINQWLRMLYAESLNGQTIALAYRNEATNPPVGSFTTIAEGVDPGTTARYFQYRLTFTSTNGLSPTVSQVTGDYLIDNVTAQLPFAWTEDEALKVCVTDNSHNATGYSDINGTTIIYDPVQEAWQYAQIPVFYVVYFKGLLYGADSGSGKLWLLNNTYQANGSNLTRQFTTGQIDFDTPDFDKYFDRIEVVTVPSGSGGITLTFTALDKDNTSSSASMTLDTTTLSPQVLNLALSGRKFFLDLTSTGSHTFTVKYIILHWKPYELR